MGSFHALAPVVVWVWALALGALRSAVLPLVYPALRLPGSPEDASWLLDLVVTEGEYGLVAWASVLPASVRNPSS